MGDEMSSAGDEPAPAAFWARVRDRYETGSEAVAAIAAEAGLSRAALIARARAEGWRLRSGPSSKLQGTRATLGRFKALLQQRLSEFEAQIGTLSAEASAATSERDIRAMNTLVRTLEKVLELERKERARRALRRKHDRRVTDAERDALAEKLMGLQRELRATQAGSDPRYSEQEGAADPQPGLADVGEARKAASTR